MALLNPRVTKHGVSSRTVMTSQFQCCDTHVQVISQKDEHCWIGELNGLRGWFPAKFVELLDERSKSYSSAGDDSISETITDIVRGVYVYLS